MSSCEVSAINFSDNKNFLSSHYNISSVYFLTAYKIYLYGTFTQIFEKCGVNLFTLSKNSVDLVFQSYECLQ